jgi:hypothetical protein
MPFFVSRSFASITQEIHAMQPFVIASQQATASLSCLQSLVAHREQTCEQRREHETCAQRILIM